MGKGSNGIGPHITYNTHEQMQPLKTTRSSMKGTEPVCGGSVLDPPRWLHMYRQEPFLGIPVCEILVVSEQFSSFKEYSPHKQTLC